MKVNSERVKELREEKILSQRELAKMAGISQGTVWRMENGFVEVHPRTIRKLAKALGVDPRELVNKEVRNSDEEAR